jgi:hypothetical protein
LLLMLALPVSVLSVTGPRFALFPSGAFFLQ